jgi:methanogenic corrinoid protein MtbC1
MTRTLGVGEHRQAYIDALMARDVGAARSAVDAALALGTPVDEIYLDVLQPALYEIGRSWAVGNFSVADEHSATAVTQSVLGMLGPRMRTAPKDGRLAVVSGSPEERHALGVQMVADFLEGDGWEVLNLGASTPARDLARMADAERPDVVALSTATPAALPGAAEAVQALLALDPRPLVVLGGQLWAGPARAEAAGLGADLVADGPRELVALLRERFPPPPPEAEERGF